jgi:predicted transcriptional regulator
VTLEALWSLEPGMVRDVYSALPADPSSQASS